MKLHESLVLLVGSLALAASSLLATPLDDAKAALERDDLAAAEALLVPLTAASATDAAAFFQLGVLRTKQKRLDDAVNAYEHATRLDATRPDYFSSYALALSTKFQGANFMTQAAVAPKMRKAFAKSVELDPNHIAGLIGLARYYTNAPAIAGGSFEKAREYALRVKALNPFLGELELGYVAAGSDDFGTALAHFDAATKIKPDSAGAHFSAARMLVKLGRTADARRRFETVLQLDPTREAARKALAELPPPAN